jgi:hypothetical protein
MRRLNKILLVSASLFVSVIACKDPDLQVVPDFETAIHTDATVTSGSASNFLYKGTRSVSIDFLWNSIDSKNTVTKVEFFVQFNEPYVDIEGNGKVAKHGGSKGILFKTLEGGAVPANRVKTSISFTQAEIYELYKNASFDYDADGTKTPVFANPATPNRTAEGWFISGDAFQVKWNVYLEDGRVFDSWSPSTCAEFPNAACLFDWGVVCSPTITNPGANGGVYTIRMTDTYGDGWNGAAIKVTVDGVATEYTLDEGSSGVTTFTVPPSAVSIAFAFVSGDWDSEVIYDIKSPKGNVIAKGGPSPKVGAISLNLCFE